jgi:hypothetical protein
MKGGWEGGRKEEEEEIKEKGKTKNIQKQLYCKT